MLHFRPSSPHGTDVRTRYGTVLRRTYTMSFPGKKYKTSSGATGLLWLVRSSAHLGAGGRKLTVERLDKSEGSLAVAASFHVRFRRVKKNIDTRLFLACPSSSFI